jgi:predicted ATP-binding protein involved in virulence
MSRPAETEHPASVIAPLRSVHIQDFRGVRDLTIELDQHVTVFFGVNAAGKTTMLDALAICLGAISSRVPNAEGRTFKTRGDLRVPWKDRADYQERSRVACVYARIGVECVNGLAWDLTRYRSASDAKTVKDRGRGVKALHDVIDPLIRDVLDAQDSRPAFPLVAAYGTERSLVGIPMRERDFGDEFHGLAALDKSLSAKTEFKTVFEWFLSAEAEENRAQRDRRSFDYRLPSLEWVRRAVKRAGIQCQNPRIGTRPIRMLVDYLHHDGSIEELDIRSLSDGYRTHFSLVVDIARRMVQLNPSDDLNAADRGTNSEAVILIDEIDLHLDPTWQATVVKGLRDAFPRAQFILTTHSEQVIGSVPAHSVRKLVAGDGEVLVENVPFAQGASGERILIELMGAKERVPGDVTKKLDDYIGLVDRGEGGGEQANTLRAELEEAIGGDERLRQADLEMEKRRLLARFLGAPK